MNVRSAAFLKMLLPWGELEVDVYTQPCVFACTTALECHAARIDQRCQGVLDLLLSAAAQHAVALQKVEPCCGYDTNSSLNC